MVGVNEIIEWRQNERIPRRKAVNSFAQSKCFHWPVKHFGRRSMANALPQATGAQLLYPTRQVIALCGDGGFAMLMGSLLTVLQYDLPLKILIFNNGQLDLVKMEMEVAGYPEYQTDLKNPNFAKVAEAAGLMGIRIEDPADVSPGLQKLLAHPGPVVVDVFTNPNVLSLTPTIEFIKVQCNYLSLSWLTISWLVDTTA